VASSDACEYAVLRYGDTAFTMQFHPELTSDYVRDLLSLRQIELPVAMRTRANTADDGSLQAKDVAAEIAEFFKSSTNDGSAGHPMPARERHRSQIR
jgi:GMP synthase (glutamine-hydrolysing)